MAIMKILIDFIIVYASVINHVQGVELMFGRNLCNLKF